MPNWCNNHIEISGDIQPLVEMIKNGGREDLLMTSTVPKPDDVTMSDFYGTKWDFSMDEVREVMGTNGEDLLSISPQSAWVPPLEWCQKLAEKFSFAVSIQYSEPGCDFSGQAQYHGNTTINEQQWGYLEGIYHMDEDWFDGELGERVYNIFDYNGGDKEEIRKLRDDIKRYVDQDELEAFDLMVIEVRKTKIEDLEGWIQKWDKKAKDNTNNRYNLSTSERQDRMDLLEELKSNS